MEKADPGPEENDIVFGVLKFPELLSQFPRITEYKKSLERSFEAHTNATKENRCRITESSVARIRKWNPPANFFKYDRYTETFHPLDKNGARIQTTELFRLMRRKWLREKENQSEQKNSKIRAKAIVQKDSSVSAFSVVFGTRQKQSLLEQYPLTEKYREMLRKKLDAANSDSPDGRAKIADSVLAQAYKWDPPATFFKYNRDLERFEPLDEYQAMVETRQMFRSMVDYKKRFVKKKSEIPEIASASSVVFGIGNRKSLLEQYPLTDKYRSMLRKKLEADTTSSQDGRARIVHSVIAQAHKWDPRVTFFKYRWETETSEPLDEDQVWDETTKYVKKMKNDRGRLLSSSASSKSTEDESEDESEDELSMVSTASKDTPVSTSSVVFRIGMRRRLLEQYPLTEKYREMLHENFETVNSGSQDGRAKIVKSVLTQAYKWEPPATFFKYDRNFETFQPLDKHQAMVETRRMFGSIVEYKKRFVQTNSKIQGIASTSSVVFGIGNKKSLLQQYPRTEKYRRMLHKKVGADTGGSQDGRARIIHSVIAQAHKWDPPATFFKYNRDCETFASVDEDQAMVETMELLRQVMRYKKRPKPTKSEIQGLPSTSSVVFGIGMRKSLLEQYPLTEKYRRMLRKKLGADTGGSQDGRTKIAKSVLAQAFKWDPPATFFKYSRDCDTFKPLDEDQASYETRQMLRLMVNFEKRSEQTNNEIQGLPSTSSVVFGIGNRKSLLEQYPLTEKYREMFRKALGADTNGSQDRMVKIMNSIVAQAYKWNPPTTFFKYNCCTETFEALDKDHVMNETANYVSKMENGRRKRQYRSTLSKSIEDVSEDGLSMVSTTSETSTPSKDDFDQGLEEMCEEESSEYSGNKEAEEEETTMVPIQERDGNKDAFRFRTTNTTDTCHRGRKRTFVESVTPHHHAMESKKRSNPMPTFEVLGQESSMSKESSANLDQRASQDARSISSKLRAKYLERTVYVNL